MQALLWICSDWLVSTILPSVIVDLTNDERQDDSLRTLKRNSVLDEAARRKAEDMAKYSYFAHYSPAGVSPWFWFDSAGYNFVPAGETLAVHFTDSDDVVQAWMNSPGHRANILNGNYTEIGVGSAKGQYKGYSTVFVVQLFGTPAVSAPIAVATQTPIPAVSESTASAPDSTTDSDITVEVTTVSPGDDDDSADIAPSSVETVQPNEPYQTETTEESMYDTASTTETDEVPEESVVVYSDLATTTRVGVPASLDSGDSGIADNDVGITNSAVKLAARTATQPHLWLQMLYGLLSLFVVGSLGLSIVIEWRRQHPLQIAYGGGLLALMALLLYIHTVVTSGVIIV